MLRSLLVMGSLLVMSSVVCGLAWVGYGLWVDVGLGTWQDKDLEVITQWQPEDNSVVMDRHHHKIGEFFTAHHVYYPYEKLPLPMVQALLAIEDRHFWQHPGIDPKGILRALWKYVQPRSQSHSQPHSGMRQGASTLTQQVVRHFLLTKDKTWVRKITEIYLALKLERLISKKQILEIYVNSLFLGSGAYGVGAAAQRYFSKNLEQLELHEWALIVGLFQSPSHYNPHKHPAKAKARQLLVLKAMVDKGYLTPGEEARWAREPLVYRPYQSSFGKYAPYFMDYIQGEAQALLNRSQVKNQGIRIYTTLDLDLQYQAEASVKAASETFAQYESLYPGLHPKQGVHLEAALLVTDPRQGEVLAMVGGRNYKQSQFNRTTQALRQPGSGFKPVTYSFALKHGSRWSDVVYVAPVTLGGNYRPKTMNEEYLTETTLLRAFYRSLNAPTMELGARLGLKPLIQHGVSLGVESPLKDEFGTLLGASEVTMWDMARLYGVFAHQGKKTELIGIQRIEDAQGNLLYIAPPVTARQTQALSPQVAYLMVQGMRQVLLRGTGTQASDLAGVGAGKTGTSNESRDNWFNGFTSDLVAIVWVGQDDHGAVGGGAQGGTLALPVWAHFMREVLKKRTAHGFTQPPGVAMVQVDPVSGQVTQEGMPMWFLNEAMPMKEAALPWHGVRGE